MAIGAILGAGAGLVSALLQSRAQQDQTNLGYMNLYEQRRQAREREKLAKSTRSDAYGNKVRYVPGVGFVTETTPLTAALLNSQQKEQLAQFREDAPRTRDAAERLDRRAREAGEVFDEQFNRYRYGRRKSRQEFEAEAVRDAIAARQGRKDNDSSEFMNAISRAALRTGNSNALRRLTKLAKEADAGEQTLSEAIAEAKRRGRQQYHAETQADQATTFGELGQLRSIADAFVPANFNWNNQDAALSGRQDNALSNLIQTNVANSNAIGSAYNTVAQAAGRSPDLGDVIGSLNRIRFPNKEKEQSEKEKYLAELLLDQRIGSAQLGINQNRLALSDMFKGNTGLF